MDVKIVVSEALAISKNRLSVNPSAPIYISCVSQLEYLLSVLTSASPIDRPKLRTIMIGYYGLREFEETDPELAFALKEAQLVATKMADGLKV